MGDEFCAVTRKKWMARRSIHCRPRRISEHSYDQDGTTVDVEKFLKRLEDLCAQMSASDYFTQAMSTLEQSLLVLQGRSVSELARLVCFGIGPFTRNFQAFHQFAFILCAQRHCGITQAIYFDPVFRDSEKQVLQRLHCTLMPNNCEAKYEADVITLFYLPHCPNSLTNNLLWRNWRPHHLQNVVVINNSFETLTNAKPERLLRLDSGYILDVLVISKEFSLNDDYETRNVFNDLSVHIFPFENMPADDAQFWEQKSAPEYDNDEIISDDLAKLTLVL